MQGANYSLNQGFNYKTFKTAWIETKNGWTTSFWRRCSSSSPLSMWPFSTVKEAERCSSNRRPLASVMGALMVADRWPTVRYQPAEPYINRAAPKNKGLERVIEKETEGEQRKKGNPETRSKKNQERARTKQRIHREEYCFYHCFRPCRQRMTEPRGWGERNKTRENFGPSTSSTSFYHHRLRLERRILDREIGEEPQNRGRLEEEKNRLSFLCFFSRKQRRLKEKATGRRDRAEGSNTERKQKKKRT